MAKKNLPFEDNLFTSFREATTPEDTEVSKHNDTKVSKHQNTNSSKPYRYNLSIDADLERYVKETVWLKKTKINDYMNDLIRADMQNFIKRCEDLGINPSDLWADDTREFFVECKTKGIELESLWKVRK